ncbi:hypothetical protein M2235_000550 [Bradyrhizobium japonicum]|nr:hypothetical protein [Bradyrhizobium japonicum]
MAGTQVRSGFIICSKLHTADGEAERHREVGELGRPVSRQARSSQSGFGQNRSLPFDGSRGLRKTLHSKLQR